MPGNESKTKNRALAQSREIGTQYERLTERLRQTLFGDQHTKSRQPSAQQSKLPRIPVFSVFSVLFSLLVAARCG